MKNTTIETTKYFLIANGDRHGSLYDDSYAVECSTVEELKTMIQSAMEYLSEDYGDLDNDFIVRVFNAKHGAFTFPTSDHYGLHVCPMTETEYDEFNDENY